MTEKPSKVKNKLLASALWYATKRGWPIIPLYHIERGKCSCPKGVDCPTPGKHPRIADWTHKATTDPAQIKEWWKRWPTTNVGIATGAGSFDALDVDLKDDGPETLRDLVTQHGGLPDTLEQITGSGGRQIMFTPCGKLTNQVKFAPGLDIRTDGGLVVVPPSMHISGREYEWEASSRPNEVNLAPWPEWLLEFILNATGGRGSGSGEYKRDSGPNPILACEFIRWCGDHQADVTEPLWYAMISNVARSEPGGVALCHELSKGHQRYSKKETEQKILHALDDAGPHTCEYINSSGFKCSVRCAVKAPVALLRADKAKTTSPPPPPQPPPENSAETDLPNWEFARELFPRVPFPWDTLPPGISDSLQQLARSCATSATSLPGALFAILASLLGRTASTSPKASWSEPTILWLADIRPSGSGKTPPPRILMGPLYKEQALEHDRHRVEMEVWNTLTRKEKAQAQPPPKARGFFLTDTTLEALRDDVQEHPTGGIVLVLDELSAFISGQNEYKTSGSDREAWLKLHDGHPARVGRVGRTAFIEGARPSIFGGVQPAVFRAAFSSQGGIYLADGTAFRFMYTYEPTSHIDLDETAWADHHRESWEKIVFRTLAWVGKQDKEHRMLLDAESRALFFQWRNELNRQCELLPMEMQGFLPKAYGYALRLTCVAHCIWKFNENSEPDAVLTREDIQRGIALVMFYMGQTVDAMLLMKDSTHNIENGTPDPRRTILAKTLEALMPQVDSGRLAVGFIMECFNQATSPTEQFKTPHAFGAYLRKCGLTISESLHDANGKSRVRCLLWNEKTKVFLEQCLGSLGSLKNKPQQGPEDRDFENAMSRKSRSDDANGSFTETTETSENQSLAPQDGSDSDIVDNRDNRDLPPSHTELKTPPPEEWVEEEF